MAIKVGYKLSIGFYTCQVVEFPELDSVGEAVDYILDHGQKLAKEWVNSLGYLEEVDGRFYDYEGDGVTPIVTAYLLTAEEQIDTFFTCGFVKGQKIS